MDHYKFFQNRSCEFFPCHNGIGVDEFNCLFCFCPLYCLGDACGGCFVYGENGIKDCSNCIRPHLRENYGEIIENMDAVMSMVKKKQGAGEHHSG